MALRPSRIGAVCLVLSTLLLLQACTELDANLKKAVVIKYAHIANVIQFQGSPDGVHQALTSGVAPGSFWALFDVCSLDVQGSGLAGMQYAAGKFVADAGSGSYGSADTGVVSVGGVTMSSDSAPVQSVLHNTFGVGPAGQYFPKGFYPTLNYRIAIFVKEAPIGYHGDAMTLHYNGQPEVAAVVQNVSGATPPAIPFYLAGSSGPLGGMCP